MGLSFSKKFDPTSLPDLTGKVIIVTGGAAGVGFAVVQHLARRGAKVYIAARTEDRADDAIRRLHAAGLDPGNGRIDKLELDLVDPRIVKKAAQEFLAEEDRLDILINCAAIIICPYQFTNHGVQDVVMVKYVVYIGHFVFTRELLPILKKTASEPNSDVRIVDVSSDGYDAIRHPIHFRTIEDFNPEYKENVFPWPALMRYCYSKLLVVLHVTELQRRLNEEGVPILVLTTHPDLSSASATDGVQKWSNSLGTGIIAAFVAWVIAWFFTLPTVGAYSTVFAAAGPEVRAEPRKYRGGYICPPNKLTKLSDKATDPDTAKELWGLTEKVLKDIGV
ncbi:NAD-P-binding protein [Laetiporus sulphureus 93-53]|uniref:NAD-P-binding protein n=1 Tax=Laetiporus sulphureus 93-53 TaxID=1314785 RepID=A0A165ILT9_9APHY|nr:NAD-P-binding protein [Laetiporus sulphureus 93-53]KZT13259.1 NAD-P-binding protein [Laetiporus sulphureus 93-53]